MKTNLEGLVKALGLLLLFLGTPAQSSAQGTVFNYQGQLVYKGVPVSGLYDFIFTVHDASLGGAVLGGPLPRNAVPVSAGQFVVPLDFGAGVFTGPARWLNIAVRANGAGVHTNMTPRLPLSPTPYAIYAGSAASVASGAVTAGQLNTGGQAPAPGQFLSYNAGNFAWRDPALLTGGIWSRSGADTYFKDGNVGIGIIPSLGVRLEVNGAAYLKPGNGSVNFGTPNAELGMAMLPTLGGGNSRADLRFDGSVLKLVASVGVVPPSPLNGIAITTGGNVGMGTITPGFKLEVRSTTGTAIVGKSTVAGGVGVYGESGEYNGVRGVANNVNHGAVVGVHNAAGLGVLGQSAGVGVFGNSLGDGAGVYGESARFNGVRGLAHSVDHGGVVGVHDGGGVAVYGTGATGVQGDASSAAGYGGFFRNTAGGIGLKVQGVAQVGVLQILGGADLAEPFEFSERDINKGSVLVIDEEQPGKLKQSTRAYDTRVAGIVSGANGVNPGISLRQDGVLGQGHDVALSGRVYVLADAGREPIKPGDLLTTSDTPGHAMKADSHAPSQGAILGKAMSGLKSGKGLVLVLVTLQ